MHRSPVDPASQVLSHAPRSEALVGVGPVGERHLWRVLHKQLNMVVLSKLGKGRVAVLHTLVMMWVHRVSISVINTLRRYLLRT